MVLPATQDDGSGQHMAGNHAVEVCMLGIIELGNITPPLVGHLSFLRMPKRRELKPGKFNF